MRRRPFTLIETLLSLGLLAFLLSILFYWYHSLSLRQAYIEKARPAALEKRFAQHQLERVIPKIQQGPFYSNHQGLVFTFDNGLHHEAALCNTVLGLLHHDKSSSSLLLTIWPLESDKPSETRLLLDNVRELSFSFYNPPPIDHKVGSISVGNSIPNDAWQNQWHASYNTLPALIKVHVTQNETTIFAFSLSSAEKIITYPAEI